MSVSKSNARTHDSENTIAVTLPADLVTALNRYGRQRHGLSRSEALTSALRDWAQNKGLVATAPAGGLPVERLNASNDG